MNSCACPASSLTSVAFAHGVVMQRCRSHELQSWTVDGRAADGRTVRALLRDLFVETRGRGRSSSSFPVQKVAQKVVHPDVPSQSARSAAPALDPGADQQLTALLNARGLSGSWAVA